MGDLTIIQQNQAQMMSQNSVNDVVGALAVPMMVNAYLARPHKEDLKIIAPVFPPEEPRQPPTPPPAQAPVVNNSTVINNYDIDKHYTAPKITAEPAHRQRTHKHKKHKAPCPSSRPKNKKKKPCHCK